MFAILGLIEFDLLTSFSALESQYQSDYAEHARIGLKPRLQAVGNKLDEWKIDINLHASYCSPQQEMESLRQALNLHLVLPLVLGSGQYLGQFVLTNLSVTHRETDVDGALLSASLKLSLREFVGQPITPKGEAIGLFGDLSAQAGSILPAGLSQAASVLGAARGAFTATRQAVQAVRSVREQWSHNPLGALARVPGAVSSIGRAIPALGQAVEKLEGLGQHGTLAGPAQILGDALHSARQQAYQLGSTLGQLGPTSSPGVLTQLEQGAWRTQDVLKQAEPPLCWLTAQASTRFQ